MKAVLFKFVSVECQVFDRGGEQWLVTVEDGRGQEYIGDGNDFVQAVNQAATEMLSKEPNR